MCCDGRRREKAGQPPPFYTTCQRPCQHPCQHPVNTPVNTPVNALVNTPHKFSWNQVLRIATCPSGSIGHQPNNGPPSPRNIWSQAIKKLAADCQEKTKNLAAPVINTGQHPVYYPASSFTQYTPTLLPKGDSIQTAYKSIIENAQHFVCIENQFFTTATGEGQKPMRNQIGKSITNVVVRAPNEDRKFRTIIVTPTIPGFPGDLREEAALRTRAITDHQYKSINSGEYSIYGQLEAQGIDATKYIFAFNLRTYDRLHATEGLRKREKEACVSYNEAQAGHGRGRGGGNAPAKDTVAEDAMASTGHIAEEPWEDGEDHEKMGFFQEELYAKVLADDEIMVVGPATSTIAVSSAITIPSYRWLLSTVPLSLR